MITPASLQTPIQMLPTSHIDDKKPWDRQENESARWFFRFRNYLALGHTRSINAVYEDENKEKQGKTSTKISSQWYNAAKRYQWVERAAAWDAEQDEQKAQILRQIAMHCAFVSQPFRLTQLSSMAESLMRHLEQGVAPELYLALSKQLQSIMKDIREEIAGWHVQIDASCDAAALDAFRQRQARLTDITEERDADMEFQLDRQIAELERRGWLNDLDVSLPAMDALMEDKEVAL